MGTVTFATKPGLSLYVHMYVHNTKNCACKKGKARRVHHPHAYVEGMAASQMDEFNVAMTYLVGTILLILL